MFKRQQCMENAGTEVTGRVQAGPVGPPSEATKVATRKPSPMWAVPRLFWKKGAL